MAKSLFKSTDAIIKKKRTFMIAQDLMIKLDQIELKAEEHGISFPLNEHVETAIRRLVQAADKELQNIESTVSYQPDDSESTLESHDAMQFETDELSK